MPKKLTEIIEASLTDLQIDARDFSLNYATRYYAEVILHFMNSNIEALKLKLDELQKDAKVQKELQPDTADLQIITELRYRLRIKNLDASYLAKLLQKPLSEAFEAEKYFLLGRSYEELKNDKENINCSLQAATLYKKVGCHKKSVRAFYNAIVAESRLVPHKSYISEYQSVIQQSEKINDLVFTGMTQVMLSREYQIIGSIDEAFRLAEKGLFNLSRENGSFHYYHALLQQADVLIQMGRIDKAKINLGEVKLAHFPEIKAARYLLECLIDRKKIWNKDFEKDLIPTWKERLSLLSHKDLEDQNSASLTELEMKLVKILWNGPHSKWDMIAKIYSDTEDSEVLENRFKNLIARTKKKLPNTINFHDGRYYIENKTELLI
jgi:tetratricopeptide (TPR) repeat protein